MLVFFMAFPFGWRSQRGGLLADALEVLQIFVDEGAPLLYAVHTAQRVGGGVEGEVQQFVDGGRSYMETGIAGCIINIHAAVLIGNGTVGEHHVGDIAHTLPIPGSDQEAGGLCNHLAGVVQCGDEYINNVPQPGGGIPHAVGNVQPALFGLDGVAPSPFFASVMVW